MASFPNPSVDISGQLHLCPNPRVLMAESEALFHPQRGNTGKAAFFHRSFRYILSQTERVSPKSHNNHVSCTEYCEFHSNSRLTAIM